MGTPRRIHVDSMSLSLQYDLISTNFHLISTYFFDVILIIEKSESFPRTFFNVILMVEKSRLFPRIFFDVVSMVEKSTLFLPTFFDVIFLVELSTLILLTFFDVILMPKNSTLLLVSCKLMKTFEEFFPVFVNLNSWLLKDCFP